LRLTLYAGTENGGEYNLYRLSSALTFP
jgi:hypothetical protein